MAAAQSFIVPVVRSCFPACFGDVIFGNNHPLRSVFLIPIFYEINTAKMNLFRIRAVMAACALLLTYSTLAVVVPKRDASLTLPAVRACRPDGDPCKRENCDFCCNKSTYWIGPLMIACGKEPCWKRNVRCFATTCHQCCIGWRFVPLWFGDHCN